MLLRLFTINMPLSFFRSSFDPFLGIVLTEAFLMNIGTSLYVFILLNKFKIDNFKLFSPIFVPKMVLSKPSGSLDLFDFKDFKTSSRSFIKNGLVNLFFEIFNFNCSNRFRISSPSVLDGWVGLFLNRIFPYSSPRSCVSSLGSETNLGS